MVSTKTIAPTRKRSRRTSRLLAAPGRLAPLQEGLQTLLTLGARPALRDTPGRLGPVERRVEHEPLGSPDGLRTCRDKLTDDAVDHRVEISRDLVDESDPNGRRRVEPLAGQEIAAGRPGTDPGERERRDRRRHDAEPDLGEGEQRVRRADDDVGAGEKPERSSEGVALNA